MPINTKQSPVITIIVWELMDLLAAQQSPHRGFCGSTWNSFFPWHQQNTKPSHLLKNYFNKLADTCRIKAKKLFLVAHSLNLFVGVWFILACACRFALFSIFTFFNYSYRITRQEFIHLSYHEFQPRNQFTQLCLSPIIQLVLFLLWPLSLT